MDKIQKIFIYAGFAIILLGLLWPWISKIPFGRLPGDFVINRPNIKIYLPLASMIIISIILTLLLKFLKK